MLRKALSQSAVAVGVFARHSALHGAAASVTGGRAILLLSPHVQPNCAATSGAPRSCWNAQLMPFSALPAREETTEPAKETFAEGYIAPHRGIKELPDDGLMMQPVYTSEYVESVTPKHITPTKIHQKLGNFAIKLVRTGFDWASGYGPNMNERKWLQRVLFLETVAGVPGMVAGMLRHMKSLRTMQRDYGWIHTLLEEAENERMHLLTFLQLRQPGILFRVSVILAQGVFFNAYLLAYIISPSTCHAAVGYLEEEAVKTYTRLLADLDAGKLPDWSNKPAPPLAVNYWQLSPNATLRDVFLAVRADEACHSYVNHTFSNMRTDQTNPFTPGSHMVP